MGDRRAPARTLLFATLLPAALVAHATAKAAPLGLFQSSVAAQANCPNDTVVWLDLKKRTYYRQGQRLYAQGTTGVYGCLNEARANRYRRSLFGRR